VTSETTAHANGPASAARARINRRASHVLDLLQAIIARHWLALANGGLASVIGLALAAPVLGALGFHAQATPIYEAYYAICHHWPFRSFFLFGPSATYDIGTVAAIAGPDAVWTFVGNPATGYKMALCERDLAIFASALAMGMAYTRLRPRLAPPRAAFYLLLLLPIALDGFTQLPGWRESTWELRVATGGITGFATVWLLFPYLDAVARRTVAASDGWAHATPDY
jgi:uncharacterized membrane protein